jgi:hypothetical protein
MRDPNVNERNQPPVGPRIGCSNGIDEYLPTSETVQSVVLATEGAQRKSFPYSWNNSPL